MTYYALGTSITQGASTEVGECFPERLSKSLNVQLTNLGVSGAMVGNIHHVNSEIWNASETLAGITKKSELLKTINFNRKDFVTLECINDFRVSIALDNFEDKLRLILNNLSNNKSFIENKVKLFMLTPHKFLAASGRPAYTEKNLYGHTIFDYTNVMKRIAKQYSFCDLIDMSNVFPVNTDYVYDGVHLSVKGKDEYINLLKPIIERHLLNKKTVAYVPLDDRPCNLERVILAAESMGIEILVPNIDIIKTCLDDQPKNSTGSQVGRPDLIMDWLKVVNNNFTIDAFIVSLDQLMSGGLVSSRNYNYAGSIINELNRYNELEELANGKPLYVFDTVMRLASTVGYKGLGNAEYEKFRNYASAPRKQFTTINDIVKNYHIAPNGTQINPSSYGLTNEQVDNYLKSRERKFKISSEIVDRISNTEIFIGVDDSANPDTIQRAEISYLEKSLRDGRVFAGADEIGMCLLSRYAVDAFCKSKPKIYVRYYGGGEHQQADTFDYHTLDYGVNAHIQMCGGIRTNSLSEAEIEFLVLTKNNNQNQHTNDIHWQVNVNHDNNIPTILVDASCEEGALQRRIYGHNGVMNITKLLAYSSWNTVGNMLGLALGHGIGRMAYFSLGRQPNSRKTLEAQVKLLFTEFAKDITYQLTGKNGVEWYLRTYADQEDAIKLTEAQKAELPSNFYKYGVNQDAPNWDWKKNCLLWASYEYMTKGDFSIHNLAKLFYTNGTVFESYLNSSDCAVTQINWINYPYENGSTWFHLVYPWHRTFECKFPLKVSFR